MFFMFSTRKHINTIWITRILYYITFFASNVVDLTSLNDIIVLPIKSINIVYGNRSLLLLMINDVILFPPPFYAFTSPVQGRLLFQSRSKCWTNGLRWTRKSPSSYCQSARSTWTDQPYTSASRSSSWHRSTTCNWTSVKFSRSGTILHRLHTIIIGID